VAQPAKADPGVVREFPRGTLKSIDQLPASPFRDSVKELPEAARGRALQWLRTIDLPAADVASMQVDRDGGICYGCHFGHHHTQADGEAADGGTADAVDEEPPVIALAAVPVSPFPSSLIFHSRPGAPNVLYINFAGENVSGTAWNNSLGRTVIPALPFSKDTDYANFSDIEQADIKKIWQRMAEDFAPFNINVTTERPATFTTRTAMVMITRNTDANGENNPSSAYGGVAYVNVFGSSSFATYRPAWVYHNNLGNSESNIAEAASHEIGHNLGLTHDGTLTSDYYGGHGSGDISWGPLMGTGYNRNVSQWSKGEYYNANNTQDDLAQIASKISYRTDDHGNTAAAATALTITNGTLIESSTPENDPTDANPLNKGVIERNNDIDVFSFVTGSGAVRLAVNPWINPAGTRGGNLDLLIELYSESGSLVASSNPANLTTALIETNLMAGRYYLHVKNTSAGIPLISPPSGYTSYGSIGQYFISGFITEATGVIVPPSAELQAADLTLPGSSTHSFSVTYSDDVAVNVSTVNTGDVRVTGPNGYQQVAQWVSVSNSSNGTPRTATYSITPPGGGVWTAQHNGTYSVSIEPGQVADVEGAFTAAAELGQFLVSVPITYYAANMDTDPGWTLEPQWQYGNPGYSGNGPTSGFTGSKIIAYNLSGTYINNLAVKYATTPVINTTGSTSLTLRFMRWLRTRNQDVASIQASANGGTWVNLWSSSTAISDAGWQAVQYNLPTTMAGSSSIRIRWGLSSNQSQNEIGWNIDDVQLLGAGVLDTTPPVVSLNVSDLTIGGSPSHACSVTFTDATAVRLVSLDSTDLVVTGPNGYSSQPEFIGADLPMDGSPITGSYSIPAPDGTAWSAAHNGTYTIALADAAVEDTLSNTCAAAVLGSFQVAIISAPPGVLEVEPAGAWAISGFVGGPFSPDSMVFTLSNTGGSPLNWLVSAGNDWIGLSDSGGSLQPGASVQVTAFLNPLAASLGAGTYTNLLTFLNTTNNNGNTTRNVDLTVIAPGMLAVAGAGDFASSGLVGGSFTPASVVYTLSNTGGASIDWSAVKTADWISLSAPGGSLAPGASDEVTVSIGPSAEALAAGGYGDVLSFLNTTNNNGNTTRNVDLTVIAPGVLAVAGAGDFASTGPVGGSFTPASVVYTLSNTGGASIDWSAVKIADWISLSAPGGSLAPGATTEVTVSIGPSATTLIAGEYSDVVSFLNTTNDIGDTARGVSLLVEEEDDIKIALPGRTETGSFRILIEGTPGTAVVLEASDKLSNWAPIATGEIGPEGTLSLVDPESVNLPARFYRVRKNL
jgi:hypothetical protein